MNKNFNTWLFFSFMTDESITSEYDFALTHHLTKKPAG
jgi:hypothetical protein